MSLGPLRVPQKSFVVTMTSERRMLSSLITRPLHRIAPPRALSSFIPDSRSFALLHSHLDLGLAARVRLGAVEHVDAVVPGGLHDVLHAAS